MRENEFVMLLENREVGVVVFEIIVCVVVDVFVFLGNVLLCFFFYRILGFWVF